MLTSRSFVSIGTTAMIAVGMHGLYAQTYPNKPIRLITAEVGGGTDFAARLIAQGLTERFGQQVVVDNRPGIIAVEAVAKALPDGYTMLLTASNFWIGPLLQKTSYDPQKQFSPISLVDTASNVLVVHPSVPARSVRELITLAKAKPGGLNYASSVTGGATHLSAELFKAMAGVDIVQVTYKGGGPATNALIAGEVQMAFSVAASATPHIKSGKLIPLAVTSSVPSVLFPDLPTIAASVPGYESVQLQGMLVPASTPSAVIYRLNQETVRVLVRPDVKQRFLDSGVEIVGSSPEVFASKMRSEIAKWGKLIKDAGIRVE